MIREETEDFEALLRIFGSHLPKHALVKTGDALNRLPGKSLCSVSDMLDLHGSPSASECQRYLSLYIHTLNHEHSAIDVESRPGNIIRRA